MSSSSLKNASHALNDKLFGKGYLDSKLLYASLDKDILYDAEGEITAAARNNDFQLVHLIENLLDKLAKSATANSLQLQREYTLLMQVSELRREADCKEREYEGALRELNRAKNEKNSAIQKITDVESRHLAVVSDLSKTVSNMQMMNKQAEKEIVKKDLIISRLHEKLTWRLCNSSQLSDTVLQKFRGSDCVEMFNANSFGSGARVETDVTTIVEAETERLFNELSYKVRDLAARNENQCSFIKQVGLYLEDLYNRWQSDEMAELPVVLEIISDHPENIASDFRAVRDFLLSWVDELSGLYDSGRVSQQVVEEKDQEISHLQKELSDATENWQKAIETMQKWKDYRQKEGNNKAT